MTIDSILAAGNGLEDLVWPIAILIISLVGWLAGKIKEWKGQAQGPQPTARSNEQESEDEEPIVVDLAELLGLAQRGKAPPRSPRRMPVATPVEHVARPASMPPSQPEPHKIEPVQAVDDAVLLDEEPKVSVHVFPGDLTSSKLAPTTPTAGRRRFGVLTRNELRRGIILSEILGKPVALRDPQT